MLLLRILVSLLEAGTSASSSSQWPLSQFKDSGETSPKIQPSHQQVSPRPDPARAHSQLHRNLAPPTSGPATAPRSPGHATSHHGRHSQELTRSRRAPPTRAPTVVMGHNRRVHAANIVCVGVPLEYTPLVTKGECAATPLDISYTRPLLQDWEM